MKRTTIMLPDTLKHEMEEKAEQMNMSLGEFLRTAAKDFIEREDRKWVNDPLAGNSYLISSPAPMAVAEHVDRYLYGKKK